MLYKGPICHIKDHSISKDIKELYFKEMNEKVDKEALVYFILDRQIQFCASLPWCILVMPKTMQWAP